MRWLIVSLVCLLMIQACSRESHWERTLAGPFRGEPYGGELAVPISSLKAGHDFALEVYKKDSHPIVCLRGSNGAYLWARTLVPRLNDRESPEGQITDLRFEQIKRAEDGYKVVIICDWTKGGKERGIIYLDTNYSFRSFALGW